MQEATFRLSDRFVDKYRDVPPPWGFGVFSELVYYRTYSRVKPDGTNEQWYETIRRVVEGCYRMQERHIRSQDLGWSDRRAQKSAEEMYDRMFHMKFLPPGRGLWAMGSAITEEKGLFAALNNCAFVSSEKIDRDPLTPFLFMMDASMLGIGVGFDTKGAGRLQVRKPGSTIFNQPEKALAGRFKCFYPALKASEETTDWRDEPVTFRYDVQPGVYEYDLENGVYVIPDTREGWVISLLYILLAYFKGHPLPRMVYEQIRPGGVPLKTFGGISSGPNDLIECHRMLVERLDAYVGKWVDEELIADIMNLIGVCVVNGNLRRTAQIMFGDPQSQRYMDLKNYRWDPQLETYVGPRADRSAFGWTSNNSVFGELGMDYGSCAQRITVNGEPGVAWLENMRAYGRMGDPPNQRDRKAAGGNPCLEQTLESHETCCLVENFLHRHESLEDFKRTLKFSYLYAKTVTLGKTHWPETNRVMLRNRRIGSSLAGVVQFVNTQGLNSLREWCEEGYQTINYYDRVYSDWLCVPESIKKTSIKPGGTVPKLPGSTPGGHFPEAVYMIRRMRLSIHSDLVPKLREAGYRLEPAVEAPKTTLVVECPIQVQGCDRDVTQVSMWEQLSLAAFLQRYWADNQVSYTVKFDPETEGSQIAHALDHFQYQLKGISFLPLLPKGAYAQMPEEKITREEYERRVAELRPLSLGAVVGEKAEAERFCDSEGCKLATG